MEFRATSCERFPLLNQAAGSDRERQLLPDPGPLHPVARGRTINLNPPRSARFANYNAAAFAISTSAACR